MTKEHIKEGLSLAYTEAVVAFAGYNISFSKHDYGLDGNISDVEYIEEFRRYSSSGFSIDFQLKATENVEIKNDLIIYNLEVKNYRDLIKTDVGNPRILILYLMPKNMSDWLMNDEKHLVLKDGAWWCSLKGFPATSNTSTVTVKIPISNLLTANELISLMKRVKEGDEL